MSHFTVLVVGDEPEAQLAPYHEFECTGLDDQYVQDIDITEEKRKDYTTETRSMMKGPNDELIVNHDERFYRDPTAEESKSIGLVAGTGCGHGMRWTSKDWGDGRGYRTKIWFEPPGWTEVDIPYEFCMSFAEYCGEYSGGVLLPHGELPDITGPHKYGYVQLDEEGQVVKVIRRTNPNSKWDWYTLGGRWTGFFRLKETQRASGFVGAPGLMTKPAKVGTCDMCRKGDIDFEGMRLEAAANAGKRWDEVHAVIAGRRFETWKTVRNRMPDIDEARDFYHEQQVIRDLNAAKLTSWGYDPENYLVTKAAYMQTAADGVGTTFAVLMNGKWYERGTMGWWGTISNEEDTASWHAMVAKMIDDLSDDTLLSIYDCHT